MDHIVLSNIIWFKNIYKKDLSPAVLIVSEIEGKKIGILFTNETHFT